MSLIGNINFKWSKSRFQQINFGLAIFFVLIFLIISSTSPTSAYFDYSDNDVDSDSDVDALTNIGNSSSTSYLDAQSLDGNDQSIIEEDTGGSIQGWSYYKIITIDHTQVAGDLTDFPVLLKIYDQDLKNNTQDDGDDIAFYDNMGNKLPHEIESYNISYSGTQAELIAWVKTDLSSSVDTTITMKYGNPSIGPQENPTQVWNSNYLGVWHLKEDPSGTAPQILDSTYSNNGTSVGSMTSSDQVDGQIDGSLDFDGSDDYINMGSSIDIASSSFTVSTWAKRSSSSSADIIFQQGSAGQNTGFHAGFRDSGIFTCAFWADDLDTSLSYNDTNWHYWSCTYDSATKSREIFRDGVSIASDTAANHFTGSGTFYLGFDGMVSEGFHGQLDESRLLNTPLSSQWLQTEFNNQNNPSSFSSLSNQYELTGYGWNYEKEITIDNTKVAGDLTNFPVLISIDDADLKDYAQADGDDIAFFAANDHQLAHEIESYDQAGNGTHAKLVAWVKLDLSGSVDTNITMKYGNPDLVSQENPELVWDFGYQGVWHLNEDPSGSAPQMLDSTSNNNDGTTANSPTQVTGKIDNGLGFDDTNERSVDVSDSSSLQLSSTIVVSAWVKLADSDSDVGLVVNKWGSTSTDRNYWLGKLNQNTFAFYVDDSQSVEIDLSNFTDGSWHQVTGIAEGSTIKLYVDGSEINSASYTGSSTTGTSILAIGRASGSVWQEWHGDIDEVRISQTSKDANWILTEFNNQNDPSSFYSISSQAETTTVTIEEIVSVGAESGDTLVSPTITGVTGDLYLAIVSSKAYEDLTSVSGLGMTWSELADQPAGRSQTGISMWWAQGSATTGSVTATYAAAITSSMTMQVLRFSGVHDLDPIGNYSSSNTNGVNGAGSGGVDDNYPNLNLTTTSNRSMVFGAVAVRTHSLTPGVGYSFVSSSYAGSGGGTSGINTEEKGVAFPGLVSVNGTLSADVDWALIGVEIKGESLFDANYQLEWEHQAQSVDTTKEKYNLTIFGHSSDAQESFEIQIWNSTSASWTNPLQTKIGLTEQWYNITIDRSLVASTITWRYRGDFEIDDIDQTTLNIDYAGIASYHDNPIIVSAPSDTQYNEGSSGNTLTWNATDSNPDTYTLYRNGSQVSSGSWTNANEITNNIDGLSKGVYNYTIIIIDTFGNQVIDTVYVTVIDATDPVFVSTPADLQYDEGTTGHTLTWNSTDTHPDYYTIYQNGTPVDTASWANATEIIINVDNLSKGYYNYTIVVYDTSGNQAIDMAFVTVNDVTDPVFASTPADLQYNEGTTGHTLNWNSTDLYEDYYIIYENGTQVDTGSWSSSTNITINVDGLSTGDYNYTVVVYDTSGNMAIDTVIVTVVDQNPPTLLSPEDLQYNEGSSGNTLTWNATDSNPDTYTLYRNGSQVSSGSWTNDNNITHNIDGLSKGVYNYTIVIIDTFGNQVIDTVYVTVIDATDPVFVSTPADLQYDEGTTGHTLTWNSTDAHPDYYTIYQNGTSVDTGSWTSATEIIINVDNLSKGYYNYTIVVYDTSGNQAIDTAYITVDDVINPVFVSTPTDLQYNEETTGHTLSWNSTDIHPDYYVVYENGTQVDTGSWTNANNITVSVDGLLKGYYNYTIVVYDTSGNMVNDTVFVTVVDENPPTLSSPADIQYIEGTIDNKIIWNAVDNYPDVMKIYRNGTVILSTSWNNGDIEINVDGLAAGVYNYTIVVWDKSNNYSSDTVYVTVIDNVAPTINSPANITYSEGTTGNTIDWSGSDLHPDDYIVYQNGSVVDTGIWTSSISYNIDGLSKGFYNFTIIIYDTSDNSANDTVFVTVVDTTNPGIDQPNDVLYAFGSTGNSINWTATDNYPDTYVIYQNGSQVDTGSWTSGTPISINVDGHGLGDYNYTIVVTDVSGNSATDTVIVSVVDATELTISSPSDIIYSEGSTGNQIDWTGVDDQPDNYTIYQNGSQVDTGSWSSGVTISYNIDGLVKGAYNFTIIIADTLGNTVNDTVIVTVVDTTSPIFVTSPTDLEYNESDTGNSLTWNSTDLYPDTYIIYQNGSVVDSGIWNNATTITINVDGLLKGIYNYTIVVVDTSGNEGIDFVWVTVKDGTDPVFTYIPEDRTFAEGSSGNKINWTATDSYEGNYIILQNGSQVDTGSWTNANEINYTTDGLLKGDYNFTIIVSDSSGNSIYDTVFVTVLDLTPPSLSSPADIQYDEGSTGNQIVWNINDNYPDTMTLYRNGTSLFSSSWTSGNTAINIDGLSKGAYNYTILVFDKSGNFAVDSVIVTVVDNTDPTIDSPTDISYSEGSSGNTIDWTVSDLHPDNYIIYQNGSVDDTGTWSSSISYNIDGLSKGSYNFTIVIFDTSGNSANDTVIVTVNDTTDPVINNPSDIQYSEGSTGNVIPWTISDNYSGNYTVYMNSTEVETGLWSSGVAIDYNIDGLSKGNYNFTIIAFDASDNSVWDIVYVSVIDTTDPIYVSSPSDQQYVEGDTGNLLVWNTTDKYPNNYEIYLNGSLIDSGSWTNTTDISINIDGLVKGDYNYTIVVYDNSNNKASHTTIVSVIELTPPQITYTSGDQTIIEGSTGNTLEWNVIDNYPDIYEIYQNDSFFYSDSWSNDTLESVGIDGLNMGTYNFTVVIYDDSNNYAKFTVIITVIDTTSPEITSSIDNLEVIVGTTGNSLSWSVTDKNSDAYQIYQNGTLVLSDTWDSSETIIYNIDGLDMGTYNFTLVVYDTSFNSNSSITIVYVDFIETNFPQVSYNSVVYEGYTDVITGNWTDLDGKLIPSGLIIATLNSSELDPSTIVDGTFFLSVDYSSLDSGNYILTLSFEQLSYQNRTMNLQITVLKHKLNVDIIFDSQLVPGEEYSISMRVTYADPDITALLGLSDLGAQSGVYSGAEINGEIVLLYENGETKTLGINGISDENGFVYFTLTGEQTTNLNSIQSISVEVISGENTESLTISYDSDQILQFVTITKPSEAIPTTPDTIVDPLILVGIIAVLGFLVIALVMSRRSKEKFEKILNTKKDILLRLSEMYSIRSILIMNREDGSVLMENEFKKDQTIDDAVNQLISAYETKHSVSEAGIHSTGAIQRTLEDIKKYDMINIYYNNGLKLDIYVFTSGKITQTEKAIKYFDEWLTAKYSLEKNVNLIKLFDDKKDEIIHGMHIQFDTWTMFKLKTSAKLDMRKISDEIERDIIDLIVEKENISFTEVVGKLNEKHKVTQIYNAVRDLLLQLKVEVTT